MLDQFWICFATVKYHTSEEECNKDGLQNNSTQHLYQKRRTFYNLTENENNIKKIAKMFFKKGQWWVSNIDGIMKVKNWATDRSGYTSNGSEGILH